VWTCEDGWTYAGTLEIGDHVVALGGATVEIVGLTLDETPTFVYNLEIDGTFTYFACGVWVHNNSCRLQPIRYHGGSEHTALGLHDVMRLQLQHGDKVMWNQALRDPAGNIVSYLRPDIQYIENGKVHIIEIIHTAPPSRNRRSVFENLLGSRFGSYETRFTQ
jgi:hypothetical protein